MRVLFILSMSFILLGCTSFRINTDDYKASYTTLFEDKEFDELQIKRTEDGTASIKLKKYSKEANEKAIEETATGIGTVAGKAVQAATTL